MGFLKSLVKEVIELPGEVVKVAAKEAIALPAQVISGMEKGMDKAMDLMDGKDDE